MNRNIILIGMPGSGKSALGLACAKNLGLNFIDLDEELERIYSMKISDIFAQFGEATFRQYETETVKSMLNASDYIISTGGGVVLSENNMLYLKKIGFVIWINRPLDLIIGDISTDDRPLLKGNLSRINTIYQARKPLYETYADFCFDNHMELNLAIEKLSALCRDFLPN